MSLMLPKMAVYGLAALSAVALAGVPLLAQQQQDSSQQSTGDAVADAARKAREQKKKETAKPKKVYTDDNMNHFTSGGAPVSADATTEGSAAKTSDAQGKDAADKTPDPEKAAEASWRKQFKAAYAKL